MLLLGVDEAGKGPVLGSMFVAGLVVDEEKLFDLAAMGVRDSKNFRESKQISAHSQRKILAKKITAIAHDQYILEVSPRMIDELRQVMTMNDLMVRCFAQVLQKLRADVAILDAADVNEERFAQRVRMASNTSMNLIAEHKADQRHQVVSAASILAKVRRDESIRELERSHNCKMGSGYPSDPDTIRFLETWVKDKKELPPFARHSWATAKRLKASFI